MVMEAIEAVVHALDGPAVPTKTGASIAAPRGSGGRVSPQCAGGQCGCGSAGDSTPEGEETASPPYIYALGRVEPRFSSLAVEKEFAQATGRAGTAGLSDRQALHAVLSQRPNRYLARQLCWVLTIEGLETYLLQPRDLTDVDLLVEAVRPVPRATDVDVVIGLRGPIAPPALCNTSGTAPRRWIPGRRTTPTPSPSSWQTGTA
jgi:hypothetical protein